MEITQIGTSRGMDMKSVEHSYKGILFCLKKEGDPSLFNNTEDIEK